VIQEYKKCFCVSLLSKSGFHVLDLRIPLVRVNFQCVSKSTQAVASCPKLSERVPIAPKMFQTFRGVPRNLEVCLPRFPNHVSKKPQVLQDIQCCYKHVSQIRPSSRILTVLYELVKVDRPRGFPESSSRVPRRSPKVPRGFPEVP
jgi:hypothetical protein